MAEASETELAPHYEDVADAIAHGNVMPFLGAGVNLCERVPVAEWGPDHGLPSGGELARYLGLKVQYPAGAAGYDLLRVAQYVSVVKSPGRLRDLLHPLFARDYRPTAVHRFLAALPSTLRAKNYPVTSLLHVTTNYDDVLERALFDAREPFEVVSYISNGSDRGKFLHSSYVPPREGGEEFWRRWPPLVPARVIRRPKSYKGFARKGEPLTLERTVVLKIHGAIDRSDPNRDSFVITEDNYIDYLAEIDVNTFLPAELAAIISNFRFLFLGYGLGDWNLRVVMQRLWQNRNWTYTSWAIQRGVQELDVKLWRERDVDIYDVPLDQYVAGLAAALRSLPELGGGA